MGLNSRERGTSRTFVGIIGGKFATKAEANAKGAVKRYSEKKQMDVWEFLFDDVTGKIADIRIEDSQFGQQLIVGVNDVGDYLQVQIPVESKYFWHFAMKIQNVNLDNDVLIAPYSFEDKTEKDAKGNPRKITGLNIYQPAVQEAQYKIAYYYTEENPNGKPKVGKDLSETQYKIQRLTEQEFLVGEIKKMKIEDVDVPAEMTERTAPQNPPTSKGYTTECVPDNPEIESDLPFASPFYRRVPFMLRRTNDFRKNIADC